MIERGKDDFGRPYVFAGCDECDNAQKISCAKTELSVSIECF